MAYIGGIGNFLGPILGAISLTYLDTMLSDITEAWVLYYGIIFVLVIAFAPQGISGIIMIHEPIIRNNPSLLKKLVFPYTIFLVSIIILTIGFTSIIELIHSLKSSKDSLKVYWLNINNNNIFIWMLFSLIFISGILLTKKCFR